jgi:hypothetical protein
MDKKLIISPSRNKWVPVIELHAQDLNLSWMQISEKTGISYHTIRYWTRLPDFMEACYDHYMQLHGNKAQYVIEALYHEALEGNVRAIELYLKHTGKYTEKKIHEISPGDKFLEFVKGKEISNHVEEAEIVQDPMLEVQSIVHDKVHEPNKVHTTIKEENKSIEKAKKTYKKQKVNKERRNALLRLKRRAKRVGLASMPTGRPSKTEKAKWIVKLEGLEEEKGIKHLSP